MDAPALQQRRDHLFIQRDSLGSQKLIVTPESEFAVTSFTEKSFLALRDIAAAARASANDLTPGGKQHLRAGNDAVAARQLCEHGGNAAEERIRVQLAAFHLL